MGFSQGGALAGLLASALETDGVFPETELGFPSPLDDGSSGRRCHPAFRFAVIYSGFRVMDARCRAFYDKEGGIAETKILHFIGGVDSVVDEGRSRALVDACGRDGKKVVVHPGGHFLPSQRPWLDACVGFVREVMMEPRLTTETATEEKVEDMEVPF
jgi:dihydrofolate reductase